MLGKVVTHDLKALAFTLLLLNWKAALHFLRQHFWYTLAAVLLPGTWWVYKSATSLSESVVKDDNSLEGHHARPRIFECQTTHRRLFPTNYSFTYSYLLVGVPIGWHGSVGSILSSDNLTDVSPSEKTWFSVHAEDYLQRGQHVDGLAGKLDDYLKTQNVSLDDYSFAYLTTAPRFWGFSFNPVSFWYLYDKNKRLSSMILEVNNTFDERRIYFLPRGRNQQNPLSTRFHNQWDKDFHVSPFNDRDGSYSLSAIDPFQQGATGLVDNTIVLNSVDGKPKIVARVFSHQSGIDPSKMSPIQIFWFLARWWWVGFMTNPRILREARMLWVKKLRVFYRPEVLQSSIGRSETAEEAELERFFRVFLRRMNEASGRTLRYCPAAGSERAKYILLQENREQSNDLGSTPIEVKVITPAFYAELVRDPDLLATFDRFCFNPAFGQTMVYISEPDAFRNTLESLSRSEFASRKVHRLSIFNHLRSNDGIFLVALRALGGLLTHVQILGLDFNMGTEFDTFVHAVFAPADIASYERICLTVLLADRLALGYTSVLRSYIRVIWAIALIMAGSHLSIFFYAPRNFGAGSLLALGLKMGMANMMGRLLG